VTEPLLTIEIGGEEFVFMVDTGAMVSLIQPNISSAQVRVCDIQARGVTGTRLDILGEQLVEFTIRHEDYFVIFTHTFVVSPLKRCSSGILGMDFLQRVGAEISLTSRSLIIDSYSFPWTDPESSVSNRQRLANEDKERLEIHGREGESDEAVEEWVGTVELAETVTVPPLSVRIARCRIIRRDGLASVKVPPDQIVLIDPYLPGTYMARVVATLQVCNNMSSSDARDLPPFVVKNRPLELVPPLCENVVGNDDRRSNSGMGESQPEEPEGGLLSSATVKRSDLQAE
jgi:hypothetical protein